MIDFDMQFVKVLKKTKKVKKETENCAKMTICLIKVIISYEILIFVISKLAQKLCLHFPKDLIHCTVHCFSV